MGLLGPGREFLSQASRGIRRSGPKVAHRQDQGLTGRGERERGFRGRRRTGRRRRRARRPSPGLQISSGTIWIAPARALRDAEPAALAVVEVDRVLPRRPELEHGVVGADRVAVVAGEAVAAGQAAPRLVAARCRRPGPAPPRRRSTAPRLLQPRPVRARGVLVVPGVQGLVRRQVAGPAPARAAGPASQASMLSAARRPWPMATVTERSPATTSPPAKTPGPAGGHRLVGATTPSSTRQP